MSAETAIWLLLFAWFVSILGSYREREHCGPWTGAMFALSGAYLLICLVRVP